MKITDYRRDKTLVEKNKFIIKSKLKTEEREEDKTKQNKERKIPRVKINTQ